MSEFLTERDLMEWLKVSRSTTTRMRKEGLPFSKLGKAIRYEKAKVQTWLNENTSEGEETKGMSEVLDRFSMDEFQAALTWLKAMEIDRTKENIHQYCVDCQNVSAYLGRGESPPLSDPERFPMLARHYK